MPPLRRPLRRWFAICLALGLAHGGDAARAQSRAPVPPSRNSVEMPFIAIDDVPPVGATLRRPGYELLYHNTNWRLFGRR